MPHHWVCRRRAADAGSRGAGADGEWRGGGGCARLIDAEGRPIDTAASQGVIGITVEQLRQVPEVVLVSAGLDKMPAVAAALRSGFVTSLVTDANVARALLRG
jgi:DNA-binding transcriptional regulator LsrR (DeoR family)